MKVNGSYLGRWVIILCVFLCLFSPLLLHAQDVLQPKANQGIQGKGDQSVELEQPTPSEQPARREKFAPGQESAPSDQAVPSDQAAPSDQGPALYEYTEPEFGENRLSYPVLVLRTLAVLAVIIIGIFLLFRVLVRKRNRLVTDTEIIKVHATFPLAANKLIQVVEIAEKMLVLGVSDANINLITEVQDKETIDRIKVMSSKESQGGQSFKDQFIKLLGGRVFQKGGQISYFTNYKKRIDRMKKL